MPDRDSGSSPSRPNLPQRPPRPSTPEPEGSKPGPNRPKSAPTRSGSESVTERIPRGKRSGAAKPREADVSTTANPSKARPSSAKRSNAKPSTRRESSTGPKTREHSQRRVKTATWKVSPRGHLRVSWLFLTVVGVTLVAAFTLAPTIGLLLEQRGEIDELRADIDDRTEHIDDLRRQVANWDDPAYIQTQARDRLFYVFPGEQAYTVLGESDGPLDIDDTTVVDNELVFENIDWATVGYRSIIMAGVTELTPEQLRSNAVIVEGQ